MWGNRKIRRLFLITLLVALGVIVGVIVWRAHRLARVAVDWRSQIRYLLENGMTIGEVPAPAAFQDTYLMAIFGRDPELLSRLRTIISKGLAEDPTLNLGEVSAMIVTFRRTPEGKVERVVAHVIGGFPLAHRKPGLHRDGYFKGFLDPQLWNTANTIISFLGRDVIIFADDDVVVSQQTILESLLAGDIMPLVEEMTQSPIHFSAVFPDPRRVLPPQLRPHIQAMILRGHLAPYEGSYEWTILSPNSESASYSLSILYDLKLAGTLTLQSRLGGAVLPSEWGPYIPNWWAHEMAKTFQETTMSKEGSVIKIGARFERVVVNAVMKTFERLGRDLNRMRGVMDEKLDPRLVDARLRSNKPLHYWSEAHRWGPDWPFLDPNKAKKELEPQPGESNGIESPPVSPPPEAETAAVSP